MSKATINNVSRKVVPPGHGHGESPLAGDDGSVVTLRPERTTGNAIARSILVARNETACVHKLISDNMLQPFPRRSPSNLATVRYPPPLDGDSMARRSCKPCPAGSPVIAVVVLTALIVFVIGTPVAAASAASAGDWRPAHHPELTIDRATGPLAIDGLLDDAAWREAALATHFSEHNPGDQIQPPFRTVVRVCYDDHHLYVAFDCHDDPEQIRASFCRRDQIFQDDNVVILIDTFGDATRAFEIMSNPYGIHGDLLWSSGRGEDSSYDLIYDCAARITDHGWQAEFAIPFSSLGFPAAETQTWRVDFWRNHPRNVRTQASWAAYDRDEQCWPCQWGTLTGIEGIERGGDLDLIPAYTASQAGTRRDDGTFVNGDVMGEPSLTASYDLSSDLGAEATLNPDFSQVESDAVQIDVNSNFALFYPEKRPFFQEGADLWTTYFDAIYTRQINDPSVAGKLLGRSGPTNYGLLVARDRYSAIILPFEERSWIVENGESFNSIARVRTDIGEQGHVGLVATDRRYDGGGNGSLVGLDTRLRLDRNYQLEAQYLHSFTTEPDDTALTHGINGVTFADGAHTADFDGETFDGHAVYASLERQGRRWSFDLDYWERSATFRAENGFEGRNSFRQGIASTDYLFRFGDGSLLDWLSPGARAGRSWNLDDQRKDEYAQVYLSGRLRKAQLNFHAQYTTEAERFDGVDYEGLYVLHICGNARPSDLIVFGGSANYGRQVYYSGQTIGLQEDYSFWFDLKPADRMLLETSINWSRSEDPDTGETFFDDHVMRSKLNLQLTRELSLRLVLQYNGFRDQWEADPLLQYQWNPLSIFYVGSTRDYRLVTPAGQDHDSWKLTDRQYFLKFQYLLRI
jgi:hypothetical protein